MRFRTWHAETIVVAAVLITVFFSTGARPVECVGSLAVLMSHGHASVSFRMAENEASKATPDIHCYAWLARYFFAKELLWFAYFIATKSYSALVGVIVFLIYPLWRKTWRRLKAKKESAL